MKLTSHVNNVKAIRPGDPLWHIKSNLMVTPRAGFEVSDQCPKEYKDILATCMSNGWLKPVAYLSGPEATMEYLKC
jgi:hypothetical protein